MNLLKTFELKLNSRLDFVICFFIPLAASIVFIGFFDSGINAYILSAAVILVPYAIAQAASSALLEVNLYDNGIELIWLKSPALLTKPDEVIKLDDIITWHTFYNRHLFDNIELNLRNKRRIVLSSARISFKDNSFDDFKVHLDKYFREYNSKNVHNILEKHFVFFTSRKGRYTHYLLGVLLFAAIAFLAYAIIGDVKEIQVLAVILFYFAVLSFIFYTVLFQGWNEGKDKYL